MGWKEFLIMDAQATKMTNEREAKKRKREKKFEKIRKFNIEHPINKTVDPVVIYQREKPIYNHWFWVHKSLFPKDK